MTTNGKPTTRFRDRPATPFVDPTEPQPIAKPQPIARTEQAVDQVATKVALIQQKQDLDLQRLMAKVAALNSAKPILDATLGDANHTLQQLTSVILERGCDIAEDCIEIVIEDER